MVAEKAGVRLTLKPPYPYRIAGRARAGTGPDAAVASAGPPSPGGEITSMRIVVPSAEE